jgi:hypothetical protein
MAARTFADAVHQDKRIFVFDPTAGGTVRQGKRIFLFDAGDTARLIFSAADTLSMIVGTGGAGGNNGYILGGFGSLTPTTLGDGTSVTELAVSNMGSSTPHVMILALQGYPGTITASYLTSLQINTGSLFTPSTPGFSFAGGAPGGSANFTWTGAPFLTNGATDVVTITRT